MLIVLLIRGLTLPGAADGIRFYLSPDPKHLADPQVRFMYLLLDKHQENTEISVMFV